MNGRRPFRLTSLRRGGRRGLGKRVREAVLHNAGLKLLSVFAAFALWLFVNAGERDTELGWQVPLELRNIPPNMMLVSPRVDFIDVRVSGPRTLLSRIERDAQSIVLDLSGVRPGPAVFRVLTGSLDLPRGVNPVRVTPSEVTLEFARVVRKTVPVRPALAGKPPAELRVTDIKVAPEAVDIIGPEGEVESIRVAETQPLDLSNTTPGVIERDLELALPGEYLSVSASLVHVQIRLEEPEKTRVFPNVPVVIRNGAYRATVQPPAVRITVRGPKSAIDSLELGHGAVYIDAAGREPGRYATAPTVDLPAEVELVKQEPGAVEVAVSQEKLEGE